MQRVRRKGKKERLAALLSGARVLPALGRLRPNLVVLGYHRIRDDDASFAPTFSEEVYGPTASEFEEHVIWLKRNVRVLSEEELIATARSLAPSREPCAAITFDDGYRDNFTLARPVLERHGVPAIFFIPSRLIETRQLGWWDLIPYLVRKSKLEKLDFAGRTFNLKTNRASAVAAILLVMAHERADRTRELVADLALACAVDLPSAAAQSEELMTWEQIREAARGRIAIASHTQTHRVLSTLSIDEQRIELAGSKVVLEQALGRKVRTLAYPCGSFRHFTRETQRLAAECGYELCFSFDQANAGYNPIGSIEPFNVRRVAAPIDGPLHHAVVTAPATFARATPRPTRFVVLGSSVTALALGRSIDRIGGKAVLLDEHTGVAAHSRFFSEKHAFHHSDGPDDLVKRFGARADEKAKPCLIATSDEYLGFLIAHRAVLDDAFDVLHASNDALRTCLDKASFHRFCAREGLPLPKFETCKANATADEIRRLIKPLGLPLIVRLANKAHGPGASESRRSGPGTFPRIVLLDSDSDVEKLTHLAAKLDADDELLFTPSLLGRDLVRYSVAFCAARSSFVAFEAVKHRPSPESAAVGTFVSVVEAPAARAIAQKLVEALGYYGVGEVEIFHDKSTGEHFLIELNARPWVQFNMDQLAGQDFLGFLIGQNIGSDGKRRPGAAWLSLMEDLYFRFSRQARREGAPGFDADYLSSLMRARAFPYFALNDPMPAAVEAARWIQRLVSSRLAHAHRSV